MIPISNQIKGFSGPNPFNDSQGRIFSDSKVSNEFCPISTFWSLFNDQHEILLGTRGSGKTFLLKMMRISMLKRISDLRATEIVKEKRFFGLYVPMHLEFITDLNIAKLNHTRQTTLFNFLFNCLLAESLISETEEYIKDEMNQVEQIKCSYELSRDIYKIWFNSDTAPNNLNSLTALSNQIKKLYYNFDLANGNPTEIPVLFRHQLCSTLISSKSLISNALGFQEEPTWIVCVDEAEFLSETLQKCINNIFRSDSNRIALKVATLPYYHKTLETLDPSIPVSVGNDFNYRIVDMRFDSKDFIDLTDKLCSHRLKMRVNEDFQIDHLEDFLGTIGSDDLVDYYRNEVGEASATKDSITKGIISSFSPKRKNGAKNYSNERKTIYDKFAPVFFVREMRKKAGIGNSKPGWYAGSNTVRKISQGNPRMFIQIMSSLFEKARSSPLTPKAQHEIMLKYAHDFCNATQALETYGPEANKMLERIASYLQEKVHGKYLVSTGCSFVISYDEDSLSQNLGWIQRAVAYSRLIVEEDNLINGISVKTKYMLSNAYAAEYWIPMRGDITTRIALSVLKKSLDTTVSKDLTPSMDSPQLCFFKDVQE